MSVRVVIPDMLLDLTGGAPAVELQNGATTLGGALDALRDRHPAVRDSLITETGEVRPHINLFVDGEDARWTGGLGTNVSDGAEILVLRAVSGG